MRPVIIVVPRERGSVAYESLRSIIQNTAPPFKLVYVDGCLTGQRSRAIRKLLEANDHEYVRTGGWFYPNQARNLGIERAGGARHLVFIDNDVFVEPGWLEGLVRCADETGAGVVGPLYIEGDRSNPSVHCAGGEIVRIPCEDGSDMLLTKQYGLGAPLSELPPLTRKATGLIEFHCVLLTRNFLDAINGTFDEGLRNTREHVDLCLLAELNGAEVYLEPASCVRYENSRSSGVSDLDYFMFRWSDDATMKSISHFEKKWKVALDPQRRRIVKRRREAFARRLERNAWGRIHLRFWRAGQRFSLSKAIQCWAHRNIF